MAEPLTIGAVLAVLVSAIGYLLARKDAAQAKEIEDIRKQANEQRDKQVTTNNLLFQKHDQDVQRLNEFELKIAREHYLKSELDHRFQRLEDTFEKGMGDLGKKLDKLTDVLIDHIQKEDAKP